MGVAEPNRHREPILTLLPLDSIPTQKPRYRQCSRYRDKDRCEGIHHKVKPLLPCWFGHVVSVSFAVPVGNNSRSCYPRRAGRALACLTIQLPRAAIAGLCLSRVTTGGAVRSSLFLSALVMNGRQLLDRVPERLIVVGVDGVGLLAGMACELLPHVWMDVGFGKPGREGVAQRVERTTGLDVAW